MHCKAVAWGDRLWGFGGIDAFPSRSSVHTRTAWKALHKVFAAGHAYAGARESIKQGFLIYE